MSRLEKLFFAPLQFRGLFVMRAALGLIATYHYLRLLPHVQACFGPAGVNGYDTSQRWSRFPMWVAENFEHFTALRHVSSPAIVWCLYGGLLLAAVLFTIGFQTRVAGLTLVALHVMFAAHQPTLTWGWARMYPVYTLYVALVPSGQAWSVDAWLRRRKDPSLPPSYTFNPWALRLLQVHVVAMYATAGWPRLVGEAWLRGQTVLHAVADTRFGRWDLDWHTLQPLLAAGTYYALVLEPAASVLLLVRWTRRWCALGLIAMHMGIELVADVGMWQFLMSTVVLAFLPDSWFRWVPGLRGVRGDASADVLIEASAPTDSSRAADQSSRESVVGASSTSRVSADLAASHVPS